ncbi:hypothetical protein EDB19DRAFT_1775908 [Suillus lakei]|nr:hypothetical protein EDB19DRAFT_1775908 [Suillus lakei]
MLQYAGPLNNACIADTRLNPAVGVSVVYLFCFSFVPISFVALFLLSASLLRSRLFVCSVSLVSFSTPFIPPLIYSIHPILFPTPFLPSPSLLHPLSYALHLPTNANITPKVTHSTSYPTAPTTHDWMQDCRRQRVGAVLARSWIRGVFVSMLILMKGAHRVFLALLRSACDA